MNTKRKTPGMTKAEATAIFGTVEDMREALGLKSRQAIYLWEDPLDRDKIHRVIGAALQNGYKVPKKFLKGEANE